MAAKDTKKADKLGNTMADYDRWGTPKGVIKDTGPKNTPAQQKLVNQINAQRAAKKKTTAKKK